MESTVKSRLIKFIEHTGLSKNHFEEICGLSKRYVSNISVSIQPDKVDKISLKFPSLNTGWLLTGKGRMLNGSYERPEQIPLISADAFPGCGVVSLGDLPIEGYYSVVEFRDADFLIRVKGDSMSPKFNGGDIVACRKIKEMAFFHWNRIYVIYTESQGVLIKRVMPSDDDSSITLVSDNKAYQPFNVPKSEISAIALVLGAIILE